MKPTVNIVLVLIVMENFVAIISADCFRMSGCVDPNTGKELKDGDTFVNIDENQGACAGCKCIQNKHYVASCMGYGVRNITAPVRKSGLYERIVDPYKERMSAIYTAEDEAEISEEEGSIFKCEPEAVPLYDAESQILQLTIIHYYFSTTESHCCSKTPRFGNVHPYCKVVYNNRCESSIVLRERPNRPCPMPYNLRG